MHWLKKVQDSQPTTFPPAPLPPSPPPIHVRLFVIFHPNPTATHLLFPHSKLISLSSHGWNLLKPVTLTLIIIHFISSPSLTISCRCSKNRRRHLQRPASPHPTRTSSLSAITLPLMLPCRPPHSSKKLPPLV
ncbi:hypothetical protein Gorai_014302 [Gossypium raimondii]|uniref:Uncharacterized protein n=1 Tax=Gossypium raimondii TaxID=29730 RepID=A0A7J8P2H5_GOSRA|nr:hypothetical protein [Gossypium raimondii]